MICRCTSAGIPGRQSRNCGRRSNTTTRTRSCLLIVRRRPAQGVDRAGCDSPCLLYSIDVTVVELAIQKLTLHLGPSSSQLLWIMDIFGFLLAGFLITMGNSGDRIGQPPSEPLGTRCLLRHRGDVEHHTRRARRRQGAPAPSTLSLIRNMFRNPGWKTSVLESSPLWRSVLRRYLA